MLEYISRIRKLDSNDSVNSDIFNSTIQQLQHNIDLLYRSMASSVYNWNIAELLYGNLLDYDQVGDKRYINGGVFDSLEKVLSFKAKTGSATHEVFETLGNDNWLRWDIPQGISENNILSRNIVIPEVLRKQNLLIAFKVLGFEGNETVGDERFEIYVNGEYSGTAETGIHEVDGINQPKTIYGTYSLAGTETNLQVDLVRSTINGPTPENYFVRVESVFVGLHSLGNSSFVLNYPPDQSSFVGAGADINAFYDFKNNSVRPIPSFLLNGNQLEGTGNLTVNVTQIEPTYRDTYYIGAQSFGNKLGTTSENPMSMNDFMAIESFPANTVTIYLEPYDNYGDLVFDKGNYLIKFNDPLKEWKFNSITVDNNASLLFDITTHANDTDISIDTITVKGQSRFEIRADGTKAVTLRNDNGFYVSENSIVDFEIGVFSSPISNAKAFKVMDHSKVTFTLPNGTLLDNADAFHGFGVSTGPIVLDEYSSLKFNCNNPTLKMHVGRGATETVAIELTNHAHLVVTGFDQLSTSSTERKFKGDLHSSFEIYGDIQLDTGITSFQTAHMELFSTFGMTQDTELITQDLVESFVYQIQE